MVEIRLNPKNPRIIKNKSFKKLVQSIKDFPKMMELRPIVYDPETGYIIGGNQRFKACKELGYNDIPENWIVSADKLTEDEKKRFIVEDNLSFGEFDVNMLIPFFDKTDLIDWGMEERELNKQILKNKYNSKEGLKARFVVPPYSTLDGRQGYWTDRKKLWKNLIDDNAETREDLIYANSTMQIANSSSVLDPVLSELICRWFGLDNGTKTFDPFAGDTVFGYVASSLGHQFTGIELRQEQVDINTKRNAEFSKCKYICDDGMNVDKHIEPESQDLMFSCPPYYDLEVYSDLDKDASNQDTYEDFLKIIDTAFSKSIKLLKNNRFACIVCGDIRDKEGFYRGFPDDIKSIFRKNGMELYNDLVLMDPTGTAGIGAGVIMGVHRKVIKVHQNVLVFYKGEAKHIRTTYKSIDTTREEQPQNNDKQIKLDPVLSEVLCRWFGKDKDTKTFDPFAGNNTFGYVASSLGHQFTGIELRQEQVDINNKSNAEFSKCKYICDDAINVDKHIEPESQDLMVSYPPYYDVAECSDFWNDASNQKTYQEFLNIIDTAYTKSATLLKKNRFACVVSGDVRNENGFYCGFQDDIKAIFKRNGMNLYNEMILIDPDAIVGAETLGDNRKVVKVHQNVLVFYNGDPKQIKNNFKKIEFKIEDFLQNEKLK